MTRTCPLYFLLYENLNTTKESKMTSMICRACRHLCLHTNCMIPPDDDQLLTLADTNKITLLWQNRYWLTPHPHFPLNLCYLLQDGRFQIIFCSLLSFVSLIGFFDLNMIFCPCQLWSLYYGDLSHLNCFKTFLNKAFIKPPRFYKMIPF